MKTKETINNTGIRLLFLVMTAAAVLMTGCGGKQTAQEPVSEKTAAVDIDLAAMSGTVVYAQVQDMLYNPESYKGKTVKMTGTFNVFVTEATEQVYTACLIQDATACCAQGLEFELTGNNQYPEDYPEIGDAITVTGVFDTYLEGEYEYCTLRNAQMTV